MEYGERGKCVHIYQLNHDPCPQQESQYRKCMRCTIQNTTKQIMSIMNLNTTSKCHMTFDLIVSELIICREAAPRHQETASPSQQPTSTSNTAVSQATFIRKQSHPGSAGTSLSSSKQQPRVFRVKPFKPRSPVTSPLLSFLVSGHDIKATSVPIHVDRENKPPFANGFWIFDADW
jgi:hypothetical protein